MGWCGLAQTHAHVDKPGIVLNRPQGRKPHLPINSRLVRDCVTACECAESKEGRKEWTNQPLNKQASLDMGLTVDWRGKVQSHRFVLECNLTPIDFVERALDDNL